jgi:hypothetical protein
MDRQTCPHCHRLLPQTRPDGRCVGCGEKLPAELQASPEHALPLQGAFSGEAEKPWEGTWEKLVNQVWKVHFSKGSIYEALPPLERKAIVLWDLHRQVYNGGFGQWVRNGYARSSREIVDATEEIGTNAAMEVQAIVKQMSILLQTERITEDEWEDAMSDYTNRYYHVMANFEDDVDKWLADRIKP